MKYLKFYFFSFIYFYKDKPESWIPEYRSLFLVSITVTSSVSLILLTFYPNLIGIYPFARLALVGLFLAFSATMQRVLISSGKYHAIFKEFEDHPMNTKSNRMACWFIWIVTFIAPITLSIIQKGYIR